MPDYPAPPVQDEPRGAGATAHPGRPGRPGTVVDTTAARYVWEWPAFPQYYIPLADVAPDVLVDEQATEETPRGDVKRYGLRVGDIERHRGGQGARCGQGGRPRRHGALRVVGARRLVRGGRAGLRPPAQSVLARRRHPLDPHGAGGVPRRGAGRVLVTRPVLRDRAPDPLLPQPDGRRLHAPRGDRDPDRVPLQGRHDRLLVVGDRGAHPPRHRLGLRLPDPRPAARSPAWSPSTTRSSTSSSTASSSSDRSTHFS